MAKTFPSPYPDAVTFAMITTALKSLGFRMAVADDIAAFKEPKTETTLAFHKTNAHIPVRPAYVLAAKLAIIHRGVANESTFERALADAKMAHRQDGFTGRASKAGETRARAMKTTRSLAVSTNCIATECTGASASSLGRTLRAGGQIVPKKPKIVKILSTKPKPRY